MVWDLKYKTVRWSFVESLEPAQVVHVRSSGMVNQSNMYGQVTVRLHTRQVEWLFYLLRIKYINNNLRAPMCSSVALRNEYQTSSWNGLTRSEPKFEFSTPLPPVCILWFLVYPECVCACLDAI